MIDFDIGSMIANGLDYIMIVDKNCNIIFNTRYIAQLNDASLEYDPLDIVNKNLFEVYPELDRKESSFVRCLNSQQIIVKKNQYYRDFRGNVFVTNNVTVPMMRNGQMVAAAELAMDAHPDEEDHVKLNRKFDDYVFRLQKNAGEINFDSIVTGDKNMRACIERARQLTDPAMPVLIYGETGTGKELFAQSIIANSNIPRNKVVVQNCAAIPNFLMESIFFGAEKGSYTGAETQIGLFEQADRGILFLDELHALPYEMQSKFLRVLQDGTFRPVGSLGERKVSVKVIATMNIDPIEAIEGKRLRSDLFYRFSGGCIAIPSLREREGDIRLLTSYFAEYFADVYEKKIKGIDLQVRHLFENYTWDGNVRELRNTIETMVVQENGDQLLTLRDLPKYISDRMSEGATKEASPVAEIQERQVSLNYYECMENAERELIDRAIKAAGGNISKAASILDIPRETLRYRIKKLSF